jgi:alpha-amylase
MTPRTITCSTPFGPNRWLHDYSGHHPDIWTDRNGNATFTIPSNAFAHGQSYLCFAPGGVNQAFQRKPHSTTQTYFAAADLDTLPAVNGSHVLPQRIYCTKNSIVTLKLSAKLSSQATLKATVTSAGGDVISWESIGATKGQQFGRTAAKGWYTIHIEGAGLTNAGTNYELAVTYRGSAE